MPENLKDIIQLVAFLGAAVAAAVAAYQGAVRQTARGMQPLVGDPPVPSATPLSQRVDEALQWLRRLEERQMQAERESFDVRSDVSRNAHSIERLDESHRGHEGRITRLEHRADNIERLCGMKHRAVDVPTSGGPA